MCPTVSPISTLPVELLVEISLFTIQDETHIADALRVSQICARWRRIAHSTPHLWNGPLVVDVWSQGSVLDSLYASGLRDWLARSAPLTVPFVFNFVEEDKSEPIVQSHLVNPSLPCWNEILAVASRWRSLETTPYEWLPWKFFLFGQLSGLALPNLEALCLSVKDRAGATESFPATPRLRKLSLQVDWDASNLHLPWTQLHELHLACDCPDTALHILRQCRNLVRASLNGIETYEDASPRWTEQIVTLKHLRILSLTFEPIEGNGFFQCIPLLDCTSAPELEEFSLSIEGESRWEDVTSLSAFLSRSPNITRLKLPPIESIMDEALMNALHYMRNVTHLEVGCIEVGDDAEPLITALTYKDGVQALLPCLHHLVLQGPGLDDMPKILAGMILSRWWKDAELVAHGHGTSPPPVARWMRLELGDNIMEVVGAEMRVARGDDGFGGLFECLKF